MLCIHLLALSLISKNSNIHIALKESLDVRLIDKFHIVDDLNYKSMVSLLMSKRIDAFIAWPSMVSELLDDKANIKNIRSIKINGLFKENIYSYVACSKTLEGLRLIEQANTIISNKTNHVEMYQQSIEQLDQYSQGEFISLLNLAL